MVHKHPVVGVSFWALFEDVKDVLRTRHVENLEFLILVGPFEGLLSGERIGEYFNLNHKRHLA